ncbi:MAG: hypothetical protein N4A61_08680 [Pelagimonas sp.]|nr:hypothetical protein [Pelagimonas sp.]
MGILAAAALLSVLFMICAIAAVKRLLDGRAPLLNSLCFMMTLPLAGFWLHHLTPLDLGFARDTGDGWATVSGFVVCLASAIIGGILFAWGGARD